MDRMNRMKLKPRPDARPKERHRPRTKRSTARPTVADATPIAPSLRTPAVVVHRVERIERVNVAKRRLDVIMTVLLALPVAVVTLVAMGLIRLTSRGPAIYSQTRLGRFGRTFTIYKLRTMRHNCEAGTGATWSVKGDSRITGLGRILRRLHIDELPQLWNVWQGDMSLVGPRPERPEIVAGLRTQIRGYDRRLEVLPGVTGFAQVHLPPDETTDCVRRKLVYDRFYVRHASLGTDLKILMLTGLKVFGMKRLYARNR
jgi:lipopolysaccharide/colanic/teichoic acid biosynthesis glycosyltransferase